MTCSFCNIPAKCSCETNQKLEIGMAQEQNGSDHRPCHPMKLLGLDV